MTRYLAQNLFASFCFSLTILPALDAEKIDNRDKQLEPDGTALGLTEGGAPVALRSADVSRVRHYQLNVMK